MDAVAAEQIVDAAADAWARRMWMDGDLRYLLLDHQLDDYDDFRRWNTERQTQEHLDWCASLDALYDNLWVDECGRRYGKSAKWLICDVEEAIRRPQARGLIACALQKSIGEIIVPLTKVLFRDAPPGYFPHYRGTHGADHECLYIEATESVIKLVGLDKHPDATRGQYLDFAHISEAAFVRGMAGIGGLGELIRGTLMHQFQNRPWAWIALETSTARIRDCDFNIEFREDARLRGTYRKHTIRDNTSLTEADIAKEERRSGGRNSTTCKRELYCEEVREESLMVVPEFDATRHIVDAPERPKYAHCYVAMDPGTDDMLGLVFGYWDFDRARLVIERSHAKQNMSTAEAASLIKTWEAELWGSLRVEGPRLLNDKGYSARDFRPANKLGYEDPEGVWTYWGNDRFMPNPYRRISDVAKQQVLDLQVTHGIHFMTTAKDDAEAQRNALRNAFAEDKIEIVRDSGPLAAQLESGMWRIDAQGRRVDWQRTATLGHLDCLAALIYLWRNLERQLNPHPPAVVDLKQQGVAALPWHADERRNNDRTAARLQSALYGRRRR